MEKKGLSKRDEQFIETLNEFLRYYDKRDSLSRTQTEIMNYLKNNRLLSFVNNGDRLIKTTVIRTNYNFGHPKGLSCENTLTIDYANNEDVDHTTINALTKDREDNTTVDIYIIIYRESDYDLEKIRQYYSSIIDNRGNNENTK
jgi:hypothetical protein